MNLNNVVNKEEELRKLNEKRSEFLSELKRAKGMLANEKFVSKAPPHLVEAEEQKVMKYEDLLQKVETRIQNLG